MIAYDYTTLAAFLGVSQRTARRMIADVWRDASQAHRRTTILKPIGSGAWRNARAIWVETHTPSNTP